MQSGNPTPGGAGPSGIVPDLQARNAVGVFDDYQEADAAVAELVAAGYPREGLSIVRREAGTPPRRSASETHAGAGAGLGAVVGGAVVGGAVVGGAAVGLLALVVPGYGPLAVAGPLAAVLGAIKGGALGALAGSFAGLGVPTEDARRYEELVRAGGEFVVVQAPDPDAAQRACGLLEQHGAHDCASYTPAL
jgi:hypothetical protein